MLSNGLNIISVAAIVIFIHACELTDSFSGADVGILEGEWLCEEHSEFYKSASITYYNVYISSDPDANDRVIIDNFYQLGDVGVRATVSGTAIYITSQTLEGGFTVSGSGTISDHGGRIDWNYTVDDGSHVPDHVAAVYTRK